MNTLVALLLTLVWGASFDMTASLSDDKDDCEFTIRLTQESSAEVEYEFEVVVLASAIPGSPQVGEKGFAVLGGRLDNSGDDSNEPMSYLKIGAVKYTGLN